MIVRAWRVNLAVLIALSLTGCASSTRETDTLSTHWAEGHSNRTAADLDVSHTLSSRTLTTGSLRPSSGAEHLAYRIGTADVLNVSVFKVPELSKTVQVANTGTINLPLVGEIPAVGRTARDIEQELTQKLGAQYLQKPQVSVLVKEYRSQRVTLEGAVKVPGMYPMNGGLSLLQLIATAQGLSANAADTVTVFRLSGGQRIASEVSVSRIRSGEVHDPPLVAGDVVVVGKSALKDGFDSFLKLLPLAGTLALL